MMKKKFTSFFTFVIGVSVTIHMINKCVFSMTEKLHSLASSRTLYYDWRFGKIAYSRHGKGSPVLLIHDMTCYSCDVEWKELVARLSKTNTVYTLDLPGCGKSAKPAITYTNYLYVQCISDFIHHIIGQPTDLISNGNSASIAVMVALFDKNFKQQDSFVRQILLTNPGSISDYNKIPTNKEKLFKSLIELPVFGTFFYLLTQKESDYADTFIEKHFSVKNSYAISLSRLFYISAHKGGSNSRYLFASIQSHYTSISISHALMQLENPITIIQGEDVDNPSFIQEEYIALNPSIQVETIKNSKHYPHVEQADTMFAICNKRLNITTE